MTQYFVRFTNSTGAVISGDSAGSQWFAVSDPSYGSIQTISIGSLSSGVGAGKVEFGGLNLTLGASALTETIDLMLQKGQSFKTIELVGYDNSDSGLVKTSSTVFKLAAAERDQIDITSGTHSLSFQYGGLVESVASVALAGGQPEIVTAGWDRIKNQVDNTATFDAHGRASDPIDTGIGSVGFVPEGYPAHRTFIQLRNLDGSALAGLGSNWIEVDSADVSQLQTLNIGSATSGAGAGKVQFNSLNVELQSGALAPVLDAALASGKAFQIELAIYGDAGGGTDVLLDNYQFGVAGLSKSEFNGGFLSYSFEYGSERMAHSVYRSDGVFLRTATEGWDRVRNVQADSPGGTSSSFETQKAPAALSDLSIAVPNLQAQLFYVRLTDQNGKVIPGDTNAGQWFEVFDAHYGLEQILTIGSASSGVGAGKVAFQNLQFTLGASNLTEVIDHALKAGLPFKTVELVGYAIGDGGPVKVSSTVFKTVGAEGDTVDPVSGAHSLSFQYGGIVESVSTFDNTGAVSGTITDGWDRIKNIRDATTTFDALERAGDPYIDGVGTDKIVAAGFGEHDVYLQIRNLDGKELTGLGKQWIKLDAGIYADLQTLAIGASSSGVGAGKVTFDDLKLVFNPGTISPLLDKAMAQGKAFQLELAVYAKTATGSVLADDYQFGLAAIKQHTFAEGQHIYSFEYGSERTQHSIFNGSGVFVKNVVEGWDRVANVNVSTPGATPSSFDKLQAPSTLAGLSEFTGGRGAMDYYVRVIDGAGTKLTGDNPEAQWFKVEGVTYSEEQALNLLGASGGTGAGKIVFNPLSFTVGSSQLTEKLDQMLAAGKTIQAIELVGYTRDGTSTVKVSEAVFKVAAVASDAVDVGTGAHRFTFEYGGLVESQATFDAFGQRTGAVTAGWDRIGNKADDTVGFDATEHAGEPFLGGKPQIPFEASDFGDQHVYLQIRNQDGSALDGLGAQWIKVDLAVFQQLQERNLGSASGGAGAGKVTFDPLQLAFNPGVLGPKLSQALAQGKAFQIELAAYDINPATGVSVLQDQYQFGLAGLSLHGVSGNSHSYAMEYGSSRITHAVFDNAGKFVKNSVEGWDRVRNVQLLSPNGTASSYDKQHAPDTEAALSVFGTEIPIKIVSEAFSPEATTLFEGDTVTFTLGVSEAVFADGSHLVLSNGAQAQFDAGQSTGTSLVYTYTVNTGDTGTDDLRATALEGSITNLAGDLLDSGSFAVIDTNDAYFPNGPAGTPATIGGKLTGKVALGGTDTALGKIVVTDPDAGEAGTLADTLNGAFGTFAVDAAGNWQYHLTNPAAAAAAKATRQPTTETFSVSSIDGFASVDVVVTVAVSAHPGPLSFTGTAQADTLYGGGDNDTLTGLGGGDSLFGLSGDDTLIGGPGDDLLNGAGGVDTVSYADAAGPVKVGVGIGAAQDTGGGGTDTLVRIENIVGSAFADTLSGNSLANHLSGGAGEDLLNGGRGADIMEGGADNDTYRVDSAGDVIIEGLNGGAADTVRSSVSFQLSANVENMVLIGLDKIDATGNALANSLSGNDNDNTLLGLGGKDKLVGGAGNDRISGGTDADVLIGGAGKDVFLFDTLPIKGGQDKIADFELGADKITLSRAVFSAFAGHSASNLTADDISFGTKAMSASQHLVYNAVKGALYYDDDGAGGHAAVLIGVLAGTPTLSASDFTLM